MNLTRIFSSNWKAFLFLIASYYEYAVVGLLTIYFVTISDKAIVGESSVTFLIISFGVFLAFGLHNLVIRDGSLINDDDKRNQLIKLEISFTCLISFIVLCLCLMPKNKWLSFGLLIVAGNQLKMAVQTVARLNSNDKILNLVSVLWPSLFILIFYTFKTFNLDFEDSFFLAWGVSLIIVCFPCVVLLYKLNIGDWFLVKEDIKQLKLLLHKAKWFVVSMFATTLYISSDRILLNILNYNAEFISIFQTADVISGVFFIGASTILYYFTPRLLVEFSSDAPFKSFIHIILKATGILFFMALLYFIFVGLAEFLSSKYFKFSLELDSSFYVVFSSMLLLKVVIIIYGILGNYLLAKKLEKKLAFYNIILMLLSMFATYVIIKLDHAIFIPLCISMYIVIFSVFLSFRLK